MSYGRSHGGGGNRFGGSFGPKPVETGKEYEVQITETSRQGDGIARVQGFVIFVKNGKVGQKAKIKIIIKIGRLSGLLAINPRFSKPVKGSTSLATGPLPLATRNGKFMGAKS